MRGFITPRNPHERKTMTCTETGSYAGSPITCHLDENHLGDHYDRDRHHEWHWVATRRHRKGYITGTWIDPFTPLERWFFHLPNMEMEQNCHCGSGNPVVYWSPEDGTGCYECAADTMTYIPDAVMFNIMEKFGFPEELKKKVYEQIEESREQKENDHELHASIQDTPQPRDTRR